MSPKKVDERPNKTVTGVQSRVEEGCVDPALSCEPSRIIVTNHNATTAFAEEFLKLCNANKKCDVPNPRNECVWIDYRCSKEGSTVEITEMSHFMHSGEYYLLSLMSKGYRKGQYTKLHNTKCSIIRKELKNNKSRHINVVINEFSPYANYTSVCFNIEESEAHPFCSGSRNLSTSYAESIHSTTGWHFGFEVSNQSGTVADHRFWIDITIRPNDGTTYDLECRSNIAALSKIEAITTANEDSTLLTSTERWMPNISSDTIITASVLGALLLLAVLVIVVVCRWNKPKIISTTEDEILQMGYVHDYADLDEFILSRMESSIPSVSISRTGTLESVNQSTPDLRQLTGQLGRALPSIPTDTIPTDQSLKIFQLTGPPSTNLNDERTSGNQALSSDTENQETTHDNSHQTEVAADDASDYLRPRVASGSAASEAIPDQQRDEPEHSTENEVDIVDDNWNKNDELQEEVIENEYEGLDKEAMEAEKILRRSDEDLYTLMDGKPRPDAIEKKEFEGTTTYFVEDFETIEETYDDVAGEGGAVGDALLERKTEKSAHTHLELIGNSLITCPGSPNAQDIDSDEESYAYTVPIWMFQKRLHKLPDQVEAKIEACSGHMENTDESNENVARSDGSLEGGALGGVPLESEV